MNNNNDDDDDDVDVDNNDNVVGKKKFIHRHHNVFKIRNFSNQNVPICVK